MRTVTYRRRRLTTLLDRLRGRTYAVARHQVASAARRLGTADPAWWRRVNRSTLDLRDARRCLLAQVFGDYERGLLLLYGGDHLVSLPSDADAFTRLVAESLWFAEVDRRARAAADREFKYAAS
jgi:hypothetical protein